MRLLLDLLIDVFATHRITRLAVDDMITEPLRARAFRIAYGDYLAPADEDWIERAALDMQKPKLVELLSCRWCSSVWAAFAVVALHRTPGGRAVRTALALSSASTLTALLLEG